ncbi:MAG TPA: hypothetical protein VHY48_01135 [Acidobacteriaceae bacterium]|jgi:hypothetical protein|nr:hypothetical protein [Acidobacteriaceae bacterium]
MTLTAELNDRPELARRRSGSLRGNLLLAAPFLALFYVQLVHHNLWRDELNAFAITWASPTLHSLFWHIHREGHPWLWYVILWLLSRFTVSLAAFKLLQGCIGSSIILLIALRSPFRRWEKALILASYFFSFEYTVLARMYGILVVLLLLYCWERTMRPARPIVSAVLLGLMASADVVGMILSAALLLEYAWAALAQSRTSPLFSRAKAALALLVYAAITLFAVWSARPAPDVSWRTTGRPLVYAHSFSHLYGAFLRYTSEAFFSVKSPRSGYFWNPQLGSGGPAYSILMLVVLAALYLSLRRHRNLILLVAVTIVAGTAFSHLVYLGSIRHYGITFLAFLTALWILRGAMPSKLFPAAAYLLLALSVVSGAWAAIAAWRHPFSNAKVAADWIRANNLNSLPLVGQWDTSVIGVAEHLHRPIYMIECRCQDTYLLFSSRRDDYTDDEAPQRILGAEDFYHGQPLLFVDAEPLPSSEQSAMESLGLHVQPLAAFSGAEEILENFYLYRITRDAAGSSSSITFIERRMREAHERSAR